MLHVYSLHCMQYIVLDGVYFVLSVACIVSLDGMKFCCVVCKFIEFYCVLCCVHCIVLLDGVYERHVAG